MLSLVKRDWFTGNGIIKLLELTSARLRQCFLKLVLGVESNGISFSICSKEGLGNTFLSPDFTNEKESCENLRALDSNEK